MFDIEPSIPIYDFLITRQEGKPLFYQQLRTIEDSNVQMVSQFYQGMKLFAQTFDDSLEEISFKGFTIIRICGDKVECYVRIPVKMKKKSKLVVSSFQNLISVFENKYSDILSSANDFDFTMFDNFSDIFTTENTKPLRKQKSSEILKAFLGVEMDSKTARRIIDRL